MGSVTGSALTLSASPVTFSKTSCAGDLRPAAGGACSTPHDLGSFPRMASPHRVVRLLLLLVLVPTPLLGQAARVRVRENFRSEPGGEVIAVVEPGLALTRADARDGWLQVDVEGWVWM